MTRNDFASDMRNGTFFVDHSRHRYGRVIGYQWTAKSLTGIIKEGVDKDKERAYALGEFYAFKKGARRKV